MLHSYYKSVKLEKYVKYNNSLDISPYKATSCGYIHF